MTDPQELRRRYLISNAEERFQRSRVGCVVALIAFPMGTSLDVFLYPELLRELSLIRYVSVLIVGLILFAHRYDWFKEKIFTTNFAMPFVVAASMCSMIAITEGLSGPYYAGLCLLIVGVSLLLPFNIKDALVLLIFSLTSFYLAGLYSGIDLSEWQQIYNNVFFTFSTGLIACASSFFAERARVREFELTFELDHRNHELDQRNHDLAEMDRMKSSFFANISHELRTPLTLILSPVEDMLRSTQLPQRLETQLVFVRDNSYRLLNLVNDLLDVMRLEEGMTRLESMPINLNSLVNNVIGGMQHYSAQQNVELRVKTSEQFWVTGDRRAVEKIAINLINNAVKFTPAGGKVGVKFESVNDYVDMVIEDTGPGIEQSNFEMIFDRFQQVDSSSTRKHQGTGLGLALVKELVELQGGSVSVESEVGSGAAFKVRLPQSQGDREMKSLLEQSGEFRGDVHSRARYTPQKSVGELNKSAQTELSKDDTRPKILIIEDEKDVRAYLQETLQEEFQVHTAATGQLGWEMINSLVPDLVVTDLMLPELDGLTLCKMIRAKEELRNVKVMLLTARTDEKSKLNALDNGADDFLTKPFSTIEIKKRLANLWLTSQLQRDLQVRNQELETTLDDLQNTQGKLIQSEKLNALGRLAAGLLHEVNNPLNYAYGTFQLIEREPVMKEQKHIREMMADVRDGMERISAIVRDLKTFAYPEAVHMQQEFDLADAVSSAERLSASSLRGVEVVKDLHSPSLVVGSQSHIVQVLINLFENSCQAMESASGESRLNITSELTDDGRVRVSVRDSGTGIPEDILESVFDPFFTTKEVGSGLGMGLSTCYTIIENHGGRLSVESDSSSYTEFSFDLASPGQIVDVVPEGGD